MRKTTCSFSREYSIATCYSRVSETGLVSPFPKSAGHDDTSRPKRTRARRFSNFKRPRTIVKSWNRVALVGGTRVNNNILLLGIPVKSPRSDDTERTRRNPVDGEKSVISRNRCRPLVTETLWRVIIQKWFIGSPTIGVQWYGYNLSEYTINIY